jgi:ankyrin repeat protein
MRTLAEIYREVESVPDFTGVSVTEPNALGHFSNRPLHVAAVWGDCEAIQLLVEAGANINEQGEHGFTPLMEAVAQSNVDAAKLLVQLGASALPNSDGDSPSQYASIVGNTALSEFLRKHGL